MKPQVGEVWQIEHSRKGPLVIRVLEDPAADDFFAGEIIEGKVAFMSQSNRDAQRSDGLGTAGDTIRMRGSFTKFVSRVE